MSVYMRDRKTLVIDPMPGVTRETTGNLTSVVPALDQSWHWHTKLSWLLGSVLDESGLQLRLLQYPTNWCISGPGFSKTHNPPRWSEFHVLWRSVTDIALGYRTAMRNIEEAGHG